MQCFNPIVIKNVNFGDMSKAHLNIHDRYFFVPCGKCLACLSRRSSMWTNRLMVEQNHSAVTWFVTLTYNDENLPVVYHSSDSLDLTRGLMLPLDGDCAFFDQTPVVYKKDLVDFFKRLRSRLSVQIKYYACAEYGSNSHRPHYHFILFLKDIMTREHISECLSESWPFGFIRLDECGPAAIRYVTKYVCKDSSDSFHDFVCQLGFPVFAIMSKKLGADYLKDNALFHDGSVESCKFLLDDGTPSVLPRYYKDKLYTSDQKKRIAESYKEKYCMPFVNKDGTWNKKKSYQEYYSKVSALYKNQKRLNEKRNKI